MESEPWLHATVHVHRLPGDLIVTLQTALFGTLSISR